MDGLGVNCSILYVTYSNARLIPAYEIFCDKYMESPDDDDDDVNKGCCFCWIHGVQQQTCSIFLFLSCVSIFNNDDDVTLFFVFDVSTSFVGACICDDLTNDVVLVVVVVVVLLYDNVGIK